MAQTSAKPKKESTILAVSGVNPPVDCCEIDPEYTMGAGDGAIGKKLDIIAYLNINQEEVIPFG